jgi:hypothetical protein
MASMSNQALMQAPILNGSNHSTWVAKMKVFLSCHECLEIVEDGVTLLKDEDRDALDRDVIQVDIGGHPPFSAGSK